MPMRLKRLTTLRSDERGMALIEVIVSAFLLIVVSIGVFTAFDAGTRATAQERHRARANALAEADLERMRSMRIATLATLNETRTVTQDNTPYTVVSTSQFLNEPATTNTCAAGTGSRDYLRIHSSVTWPGIGSRPAVTGSSLVSTPSGSVVPNSGSLLVNVDDSRSNGVAGVTLSGSGAGSFSGTTNANGCVFWRNLPAGSYTMTIGGSASSMIDPDGAAPAPKTVTVVAGGTNTVALEYDRPGSLAVTFKTEPFGNGTPIDSNADSIAVSNTGMAQPRYFVPPGPSGTKAGTITTSASLYPFLSSYAAYAATCPANNPDPNGDGSNALSIANPTVPPGGTASPVGVITLPALHLFVLQGTASNPGSPVAGAHVRVTDLNCSPTGSYRRTFYTNSGFQLADSPTGAPNPGLPYGTRYRVCADAYFSNIQRRNYVRVGSSFEDVAVTNPSAGTLRGIFLGTTATGVETHPTQGHPSAVCP